MPKEDPEWREEPGRPEGGKRERKGKDARFARTPLTTLKDILAVYAHTTNACEKIRNKNYSQYGQPGAWQAKNWLNYTNTHKPHQDSAVAIVTKAFDQVVSAYGPAICGTGFYDDIMDDFVMLEIENYLRQTNPEAFLPMRKIVQIASTYESANMEYYLHALCNDGTVWTKQILGQWQPEVPIPQEAPIPQGDLT